ncbi:hypothetical protein QOZ80_8BG0669110 [Eleusine coracana subsp. coracana]|nr:hypothetical protein QOZ80_8BG0669110 [Eleusine coracana subsp. coracana]
MFEQLMYKMDESSRGQILLKLPYGAEWKKMIKGNRLLQRIHDFKPKIYQVPDSPEHQGQRTFQDLLESKNKRKRDESSNMSTYLRHRTAHRMDDLEKEKQTGSLYSDYLAQDSELVALARLPLAHPRLQEELYVAGELQELKFDELF